MFVVRMIGSRPQELLESCSDQHGRKTMTYPDFLFLFVDLETFLELHDLHLNILLDIELCEGVCFAYNQRCDQLGVMKPQEDN